MEICQWSPNNEDLNLVIKVLQDSLVPDNEIQKQVQQHLSLMYKNPNFPNYLLYILQNCQLYEEHIRSLSALILKNNILINFDAFSETILSCLQEECFKLLLDTSSQVRSSVTTLMGTLSLKIDSSKWPDLLPKLCSLLDSHDCQIVETALFALFKICEEYFAKRGFDKNPTMHLLITRFISLIPHENTIIRRGLLKFLNQMLEDKLITDTKGFISNILMILHDEDAEVQIFICQTFASLIELRCCDILPHIGAVIRYILEKATSANGTVALQACEFWLVFVKVDICKDVLGPHLHLILPILLKNMRYSSEELAVLRSYLGADEHLDDVSADTQPFHGRSTLQYDDDDDTDCKGYGQADAADEPHTGWTLRKCSAASLDAIAVVFGDNLLPVLLNTMNEALNSTDFIVRESGILALGAIAEGCQGGLREELPNLFQYLFQCMESEHSLVRVISCWTMSRYMVCLMQNDQISQNYFLPTMMILQKHFFDSNKRVQRASLSAFCIFQEEAKLQLVPYINIILQKFSQCFGKFKFSSYLLLYDAISVLARTVGSHLNQPDYIKVLLPPLIQKLESSDDYNNYHFMALMECLSNIAVALEHEFLSHAEIVFDRCMWIINDSQSTLVCHTQDPDNYDLPDWEPVCIAHETLLGLALALKSIFPNFVASTTLISKLYFSLQDHTPQVRQPALALYGELVKHCFHLLEPTISDYLPIIIDNLDIQYEPVCNNAAWVIGKLALAMGDQILPYVDGIVLPFSKIMVTINGRKTIYQTVAIALCTIGLICSDSVLPYLSVILRPCCQAMRNVADCEEKYIGFRGLCKLIIRNPHAIVDDFLYFCDAVASFEEVKVDVKEAVANILVSYKNHFNAEFTVSYEQFPLILKVRLNKLYGF